MDLKKKILSVSKDVLKETAKISVETARLTAKRYSKDERLSEEQRDRHGDGSCHAVTWQHQTRGCLTQINTL